jgi:endonuclease/exonuclease/phosphatase family metal-dependent hydrolase
VAGGVRLLLDEDVPPAAAEIGRGMGLDVKSVHELDRRGWSDREQLRTAAVDRRVFVTYNRNDFIHWTVEFFRAGIPHAGVLILSRSVPRDRPVSIARALQRWNARILERLGGTALPAYHLEFVSGERAEL